MAVSQMSILNVQFFCQVLIEHRFSPDPERFVDYMSAPSLHLAQTTEFLRKDLIISKYEYFVHTSFFIQSDLEDCGACPYLVNVFSFPLQGPFATFKMQYDRTCEWTGLKFSNDGKLFLISTNGGFIRLIDAFKGAVQNTFTVRLLFLNLCFALVLPFPQIQSETY